MARCRRGNAAIEFALVAPLLLILLAGVIELGMAGFQAMQVQAAVAAGALFAAKHGVSDVPAIIRAVLAATGTPGIAASPAPLVFCGCPAAAGVISQNADCTTVCGNGDVPGQYVRISAALPHQTIIPFLNLPLPASMTAASTIRVR